MANRRRALLTPSYDPTFLYQCWDKDNNLVYVGLTCNAKRRFGEHKRTKSWWGEVTRTEVSEYPSRSEAQLAEMEAVELGQPRYNCNYMLPVPYRPRFRYLLDNLD